MSVPVYDTSFDFRDELLQHTELVTRRRCITRALFREQSLVKSILCCLLLQQGRRWVVQLRFQLEILITKSIQSRFRGFREP
jgi:hypothetical protein